MKAMTGRMAGRCVLAVVAFGLLRTVPADAAPWTLGKGDVTAYAGALWTRSQYFYDADGDRQQYLRDGTSRVYGVNLQGAYGVTDRLMVQAGLPYLWFELADDAVRDAGRSPGDLRVDVRWQPVRRDKFAAAVQAGIKLPTAADRDPTQAQVGEGQLDLDLTGSIGRRWGPLVWASVDGGYRWRRRNGSTGIKPGDEWIYRLELGADITPTMSLTAQLGGFAGRHGSARAFGFDVPAATKRRVARLGPTLAWRLNPNWQLSLTGSLPLAGQRLYAGRQYIIGLACNRSRHVQLSGTGSYSSPTSASCCSIQ